jgi:hypothetical protein
MEILQADNVGPAIAGGDASSSPALQPAIPGNYPEPPLPKVDGGGYVPLDKLEGINEALLRVTTKDYGSALHAFEAVVKELETHGLHYPTETIGTPIFGAPDEGEHTYRIGWTENPFDGTYTNPLYLYFAFYSDDTQQIEAHAELADEAELAVILAEPDEDYDLPDEADDYEYTEVVDDPDQEDIEDHQILPAIVTDEELPN